MMANAQSMDYPDFLCIGAPKAGTTWLFDNLVRHPEVWLPPTKSIHFFDGTARPIRRKRLRRMGQGVLRSSWRAATIGWNVKYYFAPFTNERWYQSLFKPGLGRCCGEIAPSYCAMSRKQIEAVKRVMPAAKIIFLLRNPIDRLWSHAMLAFLGNLRRPFETITAQEFIDFFNQDRQRRYSSHSENIENWLSCFPREQIQIEFFDDIALNPEELLGRICSFLGVKLELSIFAENARRNIFKGPSHTPSPAVKRWLLETFRDELNTLAQEFGGYAETWAAEAEAQMRGAA